MRNIYTCILFSIFLFNSKIIFAQLPYIRPCYGINAGADTAFCSTTCTSITRTAIPQYDNRTTTSYLVQQMTVPSPTYNTTGTNVIVNQDDIWSGVVNIGFNFCFFGNTYNQMVIGANGLITFNVSNAGAYCNWSYTGGIPDGTKPTNSIMGPYMDIDPSVGFNANRINYYTEGTAPCRRFVINFNQVPLYSASCNSLRLTSQIVLHEAYNIIDIIIVNKPVCTSWNGGRAIIGIQNNAGNIAYTAPGANPSTSVISNQCWRFLPNGTLAQTINWTQNGSVVSNSAVLNASICPTSTTPFVANLVNTRCDGSVVTVNDAVNFTVNGAPIANAGPNTSMSCIAPNIRIGAAPVAGYIYSWTPTTGLSNPNIANPTTNTPNTYYLTVTNTATGCVNRDTVIVSPLTNPTADAGPDRVITCTNAPVIGTTSLANHSYSWSPSTGLSNPNIAQPTATSPNTYTLTVTNTATGCTDSDVVVVTIDTIKPTANAGADDTLTCAITSVPIGTTSVAGNTYAWSPSVGLSASNIARPNATAPNTYNLTVTKTSNGCTDSDVVVVSIDSIKPIANAGADDTLTCTITSVQIGTNSLAGNTYVWSPSAGLSANNIAMPFATAPNTYNLTVTKTANGCTNSDVVVVRIDTIKPIANAGADDTLSCTVTSLTIGTNPINGNTYAWSPSAGLSANNIARPIATTPNTYNLTVTNTANGCINSDVVVVRIDTIKPIANAGADDTLTCTVTSLTIGTNPINGNTYSWSPSVGLSANNIARPIATIPNSYNLTVTKTANGCTNSDVVVVRIDTIKPIANAGADDTLTCAITSVQIGTTSVTGNTYAWSPSIGLSANNIARPNATIPNTYNLTVTKTTNGCIKSDNVIVRIDTVRPLANAGADDTLTCAITSVQIGTTSVTGNTYSWSPSVGLSANNIARPIATAPNTYTLRVTKTANGCTNSDVVIVRIDTIKPIANAGADDTLTCTVTSLTIGTNPITGNTYTWSPSIGLSANNIARPIATIPNSYNLTVTKNSNGCINSDVVVVRIDTIKPIANAGADDTITCTVTSLTIGTNPINGNTYAWSPSIGLSANNIARPIATIPNSYNLTVTKTANGCINSDNIVVRIDTIKPVANAGADDTLTCAITSVPIGSTAVAGNSYSWSPSFGLSANNIARPNATAPNTYNLRVTNTLNGCTNTDIVVVSIDSIKPIANAGADDTITCAITSVPIGSTAVAGNSYSWSPSFGLSANNIARPIATAPNTYKLTVTTTTNGCTNFDLVVVRIDTIKPIANAGADDTLTCTVTSLAIGTNPINGNTYAWSPSAGLSANDIARPIATIPNSYNLTVTKNANGCINSDNIVVSIDTIKPIANAGADDTLTCAFTSLTIGTTAVAGNTYVWSPSIGLSANNIARPNATIPNSYNVMVTKTANGCTTSDDVVVRIDTIRPFANAGTLKTLTCATTSVSIGTAALNGNTYSWTPASGLNNASIAQPEANDPGTYTLVVTKTSNGCTATSNVIVLQNITVPAAFAGNNLTLTCTDTSFLIGSPAISGNTYSWSPSFGLSNSSIAQPTVNSPGNYSLTITNLTTGCTSTDVISVDQNIRPPIANAGIDRTLTCTVKSTIIGTSPLSNHSYSWLPASGLSNISVARPTVDETGKYILTVTNNINGCSSIDSVDIFIDTIVPIADAGPDQTFPCPYQPLTLGTTSLANHSYNWISGIGLSDNLTANPTTDTSGTFVLRITNTINGCKSAPDTVVIYPKNCDCEFYVPTAFSPNNDNVNDVLYFYKDCDNYKDLSFSVFNRWGELVFTSSDINNGWDGIYKSELQQMDGYIWVLQYFDVLHNKKRLEKGVVTLLK